MALTAGIVGLGMVEVPDDRLARIQELVPADKIVPTTLSAGTNS